MRITSIRSSIFATLLLIILYNIVFQSLGKGTTETKKYNYKLELNEYTDDYLKGNAVKEYNLLQKHDINHLLRPSHIQAQRLIKLLKSVVKIFVDFDIPSFSSPWQSSSLGRSAGSGFIISNNYIITNAHVISYQTRVLVRKNGNPKKFFAKVISKSHEYDLALLTIGNKHFWEDVGPLDLGEIPSLQDKVTVYGYPEGGEQISITEGIVSRVDISTYGHSGHKLFAIQIDAAINPGNSGGPAIVNGYVAGIAFQGFNNLQNVGYILPVILIKRFLKDLEYNGKYTGVPTLGIEVQNMENPALREFFEVDSLGYKIRKMGLTPSGVLVFNIDDYSLNKFKVKKFSSNINCKHLGIDFQGSTYMRTSLDQCKKESDEASQFGFRRGDVLISLDKFDIANDGTIELRPNERIGLDYSIMEKFVGQTVVVTVIRDKNLTKVEVPILSTNYLVPLHTWDHSPKYYIYAGIVFTTLTPTLIKEIYGKKSKRPCPPHILKYLSPNKYKKHIKEEKIMIIQVLASKVTVGYEIRNTLVVEVQGVQIKSLEQLIYIIERKNAGKKYVVIMIERNDVLQPIIINHELAQKLNPSILKRHKISSDRVLSKL